MTDQFMTGDPHLPPYALPAKFYGERDVELVDSFISEIENLCDSRFPNPATWPSVARQFLVAEASIWYRRWVPLNEGASWWQFTEDLKEYFYPPNHFDDLLDEIESLRCTDSVAKYNSEFDDIARQVDPESQYPEYLICCYKKGLPTRAVSFINRQKEQDLLNLMFAAQRWETVCAPSENEIYRKQRNNVATAKTPDRVNHKLNTRRNEQQHEYEYECPLVTRKQTEEKIQKTEVSDKVVGEPAEPVSLPAMAVGVTPIQHYAPDPCFVVPFHLADSMEMISIPSITGCDESLIRRSVLVDLQLTDHIQDCDPFSILGTFGETQLVRQKISIPLHTATWGDAVTFYVVELLEDPAILGFPFTRKYAELVNLKNFTFAEPPCAPAKTEGESRDLKDEESTDTSRTDMSDKHRECPSSHNEEESINLPHDDMRNRRRECSSDRTEEKLSSRNYPKEWIYNSSSSSSSSSEETKTEVSLNDMSDSRRELKTSQTERKSSSDDGHEDPANHRVVEVNKEIRNRSERTKTEISPNDRSNSHRELKISQTERKSSSDNGHEDPTNHIVAEENRQSREHKEEPSTVALCTDTKDLLREPKPCSKEKGASRDKRHKDSPDKKTTEEEEESLEAKKILRIWADEGIGTKPTSNPDPSRICHQLQLNTSAQTSPSSADDVTKSLVKAQHVTKYEPSSDRCQHHLVPSYEHETTASPRAEHHLSWSSSVMSHNVLATSQSFGNRTLIPYGNDLVAVHLDNVWSCSEAKEEHRQLVKVILAFLEAHKPIAKEPKGELRKKETPSLGCKLLTEGASSLLDKRQTTRKLHTIAAAEQDVNRPTFQKVVTPPPLLIAPKPNKEFALIYDINHEHMFATPEHYKSDSLLASVVCYFSKRLRASGLRIGTILL